MDAVGLELHGVNLLSGANEESLIETVPALVHAVARIALEGARLSELSLPEAHLNLVLERTGNEAILQVVRLARPAARVRAPVTVELIELAKAVSEGALAFVAELGAHQPGMINTASLKTLRAEASRLQSGRYAPAPPRLLSPWSARIAPLRHPGFAIELRDTSDLLRSFHDEDEDALASLLCDGSIELERASSAEGAFWKSGAPPFLTALELSRQGTDLLRSIDAGEPESRLMLAGVRPPIDLVASEGPRALEPRALAEALFDLGIAFCVQVRARHRRHAKNPYLEELETRCAEGLRQLRGTGVPTPAGDEEKKPSAARAAVPKGTPVAKGSKLRKLHFEQQWEHPGVEDPRALRVQKRGALLIGSDRALAFDRAGEVLARYEGSRGIAAAEDGTVLCASEDRVLKFSPGRESATWLQDHDGLPLGPQLMREGGVLTALSEGRSTLAFDDLTGRSLWRVAPPRTQRCVLHVEHNRALLGTDAGDLFALDLRDGQVRFRLRAALPLRQAPTLRGKKLYAVFGRGDTALLLIAHSDSGKLLASVDLELSEPSPILPFEDGVLLVGGREDAARVVAVSRTGHVRWQRTVHLGPGPYGVELVEGAPLVHARDGSAARLTAEGRIDWRLGTAGEPLLRTLRPVIARGVLVLPGDSIRAVEPRGGRVLAEVSAGGGLRQLAVDSHLSLYVADEEGHLRVYRLASHLAVVPSPGAKPAMKGPAAKPRNR